MKKILKTMAIACSVLLMATACIFDIPLGQTTVTIDRAALYDGLGITGQVKETLYPNGEVVITDSLLIYNHEGRLVTKLGEESNNLSPVIFDIAGLEDGSYTLVAWQTAYDKAIDQLAWEIRDEEMLSSVRIFEIYSALPFYYAAGYATANIQINGGAVDLEMAPRSIGGIIEIRVDDYEASGFSAVELDGVEGQCYRGLYLDPSLDETQRWILEADTVSTNIGYAYEGFPDKYFTLSHGDDVEFDLWGVILDDGDAQYTWLSHAPHNHFGIGESAVCYFNASRRKWQPPFFGTDEACAAWKADRDAGLLVFDPLLEWGCNADAVERHVKAKPWWDYSSDGLQQYGDEWWLWYNVTDDMWEEYVFETEDGQNLLYAYSRNLSPGVPFEMGVQTLLHQGFIYQGKIAFPDEEPYDFFISPDGKTEAFLVFYFEETWEVQYRPFDPDDLQYVIDQPTKSADNHEIVSQISSPRVLRAADSYRMHLRRSHRTDDGNHRQVRALR